MKIAVDCKSPLLQKSLELFLSSHLSSLKQSDIVVRDYKVENDEKTFYIGKGEEADLIKPFSKSTLLLALENKYQYIVPKQNNEANIDEIANFSILEKRIDMLTKEYQANILKVVRAFYEK